MNRRARRAMLSKKPTAGERFCCECRHCGGVRSISVGFRHGEKELMAENDCKCPKVEDAICEQCGEKGKHWLGCPWIGLPSDDRCEQEPS